MEQNLQDKMMRMKQELRDLKTAHDMKSTMRTYHASVDVPLYSSYNTIRIRLTYETGTQPIMTTITGDHHIIPLEPSGNTQDFVLAEKKGNIAGGHTVFFLSTRNITSASIV